MQQAQQDDREREERGHQSSWEPASRLITPLVEKLGSHLQQKQGPQHSSGKDLHKYDGYKWVDNCVIYCNSMIEEISEIKKAMDLLSRQDNKVWESGIDLCLQKCSLMGNNQRVWMDICGYLWIFVRHMFKYIHYISHTKKYIIPNISLRKTMTYEPLLR